MIEILIMLAVALSILLPAWLAVRFAGVKGIRGYRGVTVYLLLVASWAIGWLLAMIYVPLWVVGCLVVQVSTLYFIAKIPLVRALLVSAGHTLVTTLLIYGVAALLLSPRFS